MPVETFKKQPKIKPDSIMIQAINNGMSGRDYTRELVRIRDKRKCQMCGKTWVLGQRRLDIHHLFECGDKSKAYDKTEDMNNLITFCHKCHMGLHSVRRKISQKDGHFKLSKEKHQHPFYNKPTVIKITNVKQR